MRITLTLCFLLFGLWSFGQEVRTPEDIAVDKARRAYDEKRYFTAANMYRKIFDKTKSEQRKSEVAVMVADCYQRANMYKQAFKWYEEIVNTRYPTPDVLFLYGETLKNFERYDEASRQFYDFLFERPKDDRGKLAMESCKLAKQWKANPEKYKIENLKQLNSSESDYSPFIDPEGKAILFASARPTATGKIIFEWTGQKCSDIFVSRLKDDNWSNPKPIEGAVNTSYNEGVTWVDATGTTMLYTQCNGADGKGITCKIYQSFKKEEGWSEPTPLAFSSDSFSVGHPAFSKDGKRLYFSSDMPGGFGEKDLYTVSYDPNSGEWGTPVNMGPTINTPQDDVFPTIGPDGIIYFSSKGHLGMGGLDLFSTRDSAGGWAKPQNLKYPINSGGDDLGLVYLPNQESLPMGAPIAYFSSSRLGGQGDDDIYVLKRKPFIYLLSGTVKDKESGTELDGAQIIITDLEGNPFTAAKSDKKGKFTVELAPESSYNITVSRDEYFRSAVYSTSTKSILQDTTLIVDVLMDLIPPQEMEVNIQGIYYDLNSADLREESKKVLDSLVIVLNDNPNLQVEIASHTDSRADADYNLKLSEDRAESVVDYLVDNGINKKRLQPKGYGESRLINHCEDGVECSEEEHQENRRTTFSILSTDFKGR